MQLSHDFHKLSWPHALIVLDLSFNQRRLKSLLNPKHEYVSTLLSKPVVNLLSASNTVGLRPGTWIIEGRRSSHKL